MTWTLAVDAMGGDHAPRQVVLGTIEAARAHPEVRHLLVGRVEAVEAELREAGWSGTNIEVRPAEHVIAMAESPVDALRKKPGSSIEVATRLIQSHEAHAMISAGNTGACVAAGTLILRHLPGVRRSGIAVTMNAGNKPVVVVDVGANIASKPEHLLQYGIMASEYAKAALRVENPRVGLLNIGEEDEKGNTLSKTTLALFRRSSLNFHGNVEGVEVFRGVCDVVVCDGFVGNIVLKVSEGLAERLVELFKGTVKEALTALAPTLGERTGTIGEAIKGALARLAERLDYSEYGGAPLLGINGTMIIAHGRSDARAIANAIRVARRMVEGSVNKHITDEIRAFSEKE